MEYEILDYEVVDSNNDEFKAKVKFNFTDESRSVHAGSLMLLNCPWNKSRIKSHNFRIEYIELLDDNVRFYEENMVEDLGSEQVTYLKNQLEFYFKKTLKS